MDNIKVNFKHGKYPGWINLAVEGKKGKIYIVKMSYLFCPFKDFLNFLKSVLDEKEANFEIDEEGHIVEFISKNINNDIIYFIMRDALHPTKIYLRGKYKRKEFVKEFLQKFVRFLEKDFDKKKWNNKDDIPDVDIKNLLKRIG